MVSKSRVSKNLVKKIGYKKIYFSKFGFQKSGIKNWSTILFFKNLKRKKEIGVLRNWFGNTYWISNIGLDVSLQKLISKTGLRKGFEKWIPNWFLV